MNVRSLAVTGEKIPSHNNLINQTSADSSAKPFYTKSPTTLMRPSRLLPRAKCVARDAYHPTTALLSTFAPNAAPEASKDPDAKEEDIPDLKASKPCLGYFTGLETLVAGPTSNQAPTDTRIKPVLNTQAPLDGTSRPEFPDRFNLGGRDQPGGIWRPQNVGDRREQVCNQQGQENALSDNESADLPSNVSKLKHHSRPPPWLRESRLRKAADEPDETPPEIATHFKKVYVPPMLAPWQRRMHEIIQASSAAAAIAKTKKNTTADQKLLSYEPLEIPTVNPKGRTAYPPWAMGSSEMPNGAFSMVLSAEIQRFAAFARPDQKERIAREWVAYSVARRIRKTLKPEFWVQVFGSQRLATALATSDVDIRVFYKSNTDVWSRRSLDPIMQHIYTMMHHKFKSDFDAVIHCKGTFNIVRATHSLSGLSIQIGAVPNPNPQRNAVFHYLHTMPFLADLYTTVRAMFGMRDLSEVFYGGCGAYSIFMMLVASLLCRGTPPLPNNGARLLHFLRFYATLDTTRHALTLSPPKAFPKHGPETHDLLDRHVAVSDPFRAARWSLGRSSPSQPYLLCLQDPADPANDLGKKMHAILHVRETCRALLHQLEQARDAPASPAPASLLEPVVGAFHDMYAAQRARLRAYGLHLEQGSYEGTGWKDDLDAGHFPDDVDMGSVFAGAGKGGSEGVSVEDEHAESSTAEGEHTESSNAEGEHTESSNAEGEQTESSTPEGGHTESSIAEGEHTESTTAESSNS